MKRGLLPIKRKDHRTYDFHKTFGSATSIPAEFNFDTSGIFPDQNADGFPNACTAYTENDIASSEDKLGYYDDQPFTYNNTKMIGGLSGDVPVDHMDALKSGTVYGVKKKSESPDEALNHRRAPHFIVKKNPDYFDGLISALWIKQGGFSIGTPWLQVFNWVGSDGTIPDFAAPKTFLSGHCWEATGVKIVKGEPRIICKSWQGPSYGDRGYCYFNRKQINDLLGCRGSGAFGQKHASPEDIKRVEMSIIEVAFSYFKMLLEKILKNPELIQTSMPTPEPIPVPEPVLVPTAPTLVSFAKAIQEYEGWGVPGSIVNGKHYPLGTNSWRNRNPGNIRGRSGKFLTFVSEEVGFVYLCDYIKRAGNGTHAAYPKNCDINHFFSVYAPRGDDNRPELYAEWVAKKVGVFTTFLIKNLAQ